MKRFIVVALEWLCGQLDKVHPHGYWGCYFLKLSSLSERLDQRWGTGVWR